MATNPYSTAPERFTSGERARLQKIRGALTRGAGGATGRLRKEQRSLYMKGRERMKPYDTPAYGEGTMTPRQIDDITNANVQGKYGTTFNELEGEIGKAPSRQQQLLRYYQDFDSELTRIASAQAAADQAMIAAQTASTKTSQTGEQNANVKLLQQFQQDAASRGQTVDPSRFLEANQASAARAGTQNNMTSTLATQAQSRSGYFGGQRGAAAGDKIAQLGREEQYTRGLRSKLLEAKQLAGDYATQTRGQLDEQNYNRALAAQALGIKAQDSRSDARMAKAKMQQDAQFKGQSLAIQQQNADANSQRSAWAVSPSNPKNQPGQGKPPFTDTQIRNNRKTYRKAKNIASQLKRSGNLKPGGGQKAIDYLVSEEGYDELVAKAVVMEQVYGGVDAKTRKKFHKEYGVWLPLSASEKRKQR